MSRFGYEEGDEETWGLWEGALKQAVNSKRGQQALRDLEAALLALPERRLIANSIALNGEVCAVGALALYRRIEGGEDRSVVLADLEAVEQDEGYGHVTAEVGKAVGCSWTFAWNLGYVNDEEMYHLTPEQRWERMLAWARKRILPEVSA